MHIKPTHNRFGIRGWNRDTEAASCLAGGSWVCLSMVLVYTEADVSAKGVSMRLAQLFVTWFWIQWCIVVWCTPCSYTEVCNQPARTTCFVYFSLHTMPKSLLHYISRFLAARDIYFITASSIRISFHDYT